MAGTARKERKRTRPPLEPGETLDLWFGDEFQTNGSKYRLLEVNDVLQRALGLDGSAPPPDTNVQVRGCEDTDDAVLCTPDRTYELRVVEMSNTLLLVGEDQVASARSKDEEARGRVDVIDRLHAVVEPLLVPPRLTRLRQLLNERPWGDDSSVQVGQCYSLADLRGRVQCSEAGLQAGLRALGAFPVDGVVRVLAQPLRERMLTHVLLLCVERRWPLTKVPVDACAEVLDGQFDQVAVRALLRWLAVAAQEGDAWGEEKSESVELDLKRVARAAAVPLLRATPRMRVPEFRAVWRDAMAPRVLWPDAGGAVNTDEETLAGLAIVDDDVVRYFPVDLLPVDPRERFRELFAARRRWTDEQLRPYVVDLLEPDAPMGRLLMRHARSLPETDGSSRVYVSRSVV